MQRSACRAILGAALLGLCAACGGDINTPGNVDSSIEPCDQGEPAFDVWQADFAPNARAQLHASVDTRDDAYSAEFRLVVACEGIVLIDTIDGTQCSNPVPPRQPGDVPQCPLAAVDLGPLADQPRVICLAEIGPTEPLDVGVGDCSDTARADYRLRMSIDNVALALDLVAHNCRAPQSCLQDDFDIDVDDDD